MGSKGEVLITIMASLAQQESPSLSQNVKLGLQYRYQQGKVQVNHNHFLGYTKDGDGHLVIDPEQAEVVKRIRRKPRPKADPSDHRLRRPPCRPAQIRA